MKLRLVPSALIVMAGTFLFGCTQHIPHSASMAAPFEADVQMIGPVSGESTASWFLGMPTGDDSLKAAVNDALSKKGGDALVNMTVDRSIRAFPHLSYPLFIIVKTRVTGAAVKLKSSGT